MDYCGSPSHLWGVVNENVFFSSARNLKFSCNNLTNFSILICTYINLRLSTTQMAAKKQTQSDMTTCKTMSKVRKRKSTCTHTLLYNTGKTPCTLC